EDEPDANRLLAMLVQLRGYQTESAFSGGEALEIARRRRPDIVFLDLFLPDTSGYQVCRALKAERETALIPVVIVTAGLGAESRLQSSRAGPSAFVPKPYPPDEIFEAMTVADSWRRDVASDAPSGEIVLGGDEAGPLAQISRLQSLLLARTRLPSEAV